MHRHTPGPWVAEPDDFDDGWIVRVDTRGKIGEIVIAERIEQPKADDGKADALLIAAAPDLYASLEALVDDFGDAEGQLIDAAKAALEKARGDQH